MAQITIYVPDELARRLRKEAKRARKSLSAYLVDLALRHEQRDAGWPKGFADLYGSCDLALPDEPTLDEPPPL